MGERHFWLLADEIVLANHLSTVSNQGVCSGPPSALPSIRLTVLTEHTSLQPEAELEQVQIKEEQIILSS